MREICSNCDKKSDCEDMCPAFMELHQIYRTQDKKDKTIRIRNLKKHLSIGDAEPDQDLRRLGEKVIRSFPEFAFVKEWNIKIGYVISQEKKSGEKTIYADCRKVHDIYKAYLPYDFIITFYERNTGFLNENQLKVLMYHELKHIGMGERGLKIVPHDIEDFKDILERYGLDWNGIDKEMPDILGGE